MSAFDFGAAVRNAAARFGARGTRKRRSDAGSSRLAAEVRRELERLLDTQERPSVDDVLCDLVAFCRRTGARSPSRATIYNYLPKCAARTYAIAPLPEPVRASLYNLDPAGTVPGHQLAFYAFQYGDLEAASFAAGLPWLALYQADRMRGWRDRRRGLLRAVLRRRGIA